MGVSCHVGCLHGCPACGEDQSSLDPYDVNQSLGRLENNVFPPPACYTHFVEGLGMDLKLETRPTIDESNALKIIRKR
jgi:hypothetical protein